MAISNHPIGDSPEGVDIPGSYQDTPLAPPVLIGSGTRSAPGNSREKTSCRAAKNYVCVRGVIYDLWNDPHFSDA